MKCLPGGGTTDYAVAIFYDALKSKHFNCYLTENTYLPMMYMPGSRLKMIRVLTFPDALNAAILLTESATATQGVCYNLAAFSFCPKQLEQKIQQHIPQFNV